jgi:cysteine-rich repeat protein
LRVPAASRPAPSGAVANHTRDLPLNPPKRVSTPGGSGGCNSSAPEDKCPGAVIALSGTGLEPRVGKATGSTANLCVDYTGSCASTYSAAARDAVFRVTPDVDGTMFVDLGGQTATPFDSVLYVRSDCGSSAAELACDDAIDKGADVVKLPVKAGVPYYVFVDGYGTPEAGAFTVNVLVRPAVCGDGELAGSEQCDDGNKTAGDGCDAQCKLESQTGVDVCPGKPLALAQAGAKWKARWSGTTSSLTADYSGSCGGTSSKDAVFQLNSGPGGHVTVQLTSATTFDSVLYVLSGTCGPGGTAVGCDDTVSYYGGEFVEFDAPPNTTYWVVVDGYNGAEGNFTLEVTVAPPGCGNGFVQGAEQCDDGNTVANDGCSATCTWEGTCGALAEVEPNPYTSPQPIPAACGSFLLSGALPLGDRDYFKLTLADGTSIRAETFVGAPGQCNGNPDTVLSLWKGSMPAQQDDQPGCYTMIGYVACNNDLSDTINCSRMGYTVPLGGAGAYVLKVSNFSTSSPIPSYGLRVLLQ